MVIVLLEPIPIGDVKSNPYCHVEKLSGLLFLLEQVFHENSQPSEIVYTVQSPPTFGFLQRSSPKDKHRHNTRDQQHLYYVRP